MASHVRRVGDTRYNPNPNPNPAPNRNPQPGYTEDSSHSLATNMTGKRPHTSVSGDVGTAATFDIEAEMFNAESMTLPRTSSKSRNITSNGALRVRGKPLMEEIIEFLTTVKRGLMNSLTMEESTALRGGHASVEVECRLGIVAHQGGLARANPTIPGSGAESLDKQQMDEVRCEFIPGVSQPTFLQIQRAVPELLAIPGHHHRCRETVNEDRVYVYDNGLRAIVGQGVKDPGGVKYERKVNKMQLTIQLLGAPYDMRVSAGIEVKEDPSPPEVPFDGQQDCIVQRGWQYVRIRRRYSWQPPHGLAMHWRPDISIVTVHHLDGTTEASWEVEFELESRIQSTWLSKTDEEAAEQMTPLLSKVLVTLLESVNPSEPFNSIKHIAKDDRIGVVASAKHILQQHHTQVKGKDKLLFPGAMPVSLCRRHIQEVQQGEYFVTEKTDGVRYLLVSTQDEAGVPACTLVDRSLSCFKVDCDAALGDAICKGTVLDGELVHNLQMNRPVFMVFDILAYGDTSLTQHNFQDRFSVVTDKVMPRCEAGSNGGKSLPEGTLPLVRKKFFHRKNIMNLFLYVKHISGRERIYHESEWRYHHTDGVIFQPDACYHSGRHDALLKWKWLDLASIDLRAQRNGTDIDFSTEVQGGMPVRVKVVKLTEPDMMRLRADMKATGMTIAEVALDASTGLWIYIGLRSDKDRPNFIDTVMSTLVELAEGLSEQELQFRMMVDNPGQDSWSKHFLKMQKQAVDWQKDQHR